MNTNKAFDLDKETITKNELETLIMNTNTEKKEFLLTQFNFEQLLNVQKNVELMTQFRPTFKKIINSLITEPNLTEITEKMIKQFGDMNND